MRGDEKIFEQTPFLLDFSLSFAATSISTPRDVKVKNGTKKRKSKEVAIFGNYRHYYGYRIGDMKADPRLMVLNKEWFEGKDCLDIGCNQGLITIEIAKSFHCRSICGVDIDAISNSLNSKGERYLKCPKCDCFEWLKDARAQEKENERKRVTKKKFVMMAVNEEASIKEICSGVKHMMSL